MENFRWYFSARRSEWRWNYSAIASEGKSLDLQQFEESFRCASSDIMHNTIWMLYDEVFEFDSEEFKFFTFYIKSCQIWN